jgi:hypothetical protein
MKIIFGAVLVLAIVPGAVAVWSLDALRTTQATIAASAEASSAAISVYHLTIQHGRDLPVENWSPAF